MDHSHDDEGEHSHDHSHSHSHVHSHSHSHERGHSHGPGHSHDHAASLKSRALPQGAGRGKVLFFDAFSGVAGDMTIAALLDLGVPLSAIETELAKLPLEGYALRVDHAERSGIVATRFDVEIGPDQPERTYGSIDDMLAAAPLPAPVGTLARAIFKRLGEAEASTHRMPLRDVHFHEVGAVDAIVDIVGAAAGLVYLDAEVSASPLPMGRGFVNARHGILPLPAPATVSCLHGVPTYAVDIDAELVTPTGAAIVASAAQTFTRWPEFAPERVAFGAGQRVLSDRPNLLRLVLGERNASDAPQLHGSHVVIECNVDDMTGELGAHAIRSLLAAGALDVWAAPITMKKGRPALCLSALAARADADTIAAHMLRETTSIGVRFHDVARLVRPRQVVDVETAYGNIPVKVSSGPYGPAQIKPEVEAAAAAASAHDAPLRVVLQAAIHAYHRQCDE